MIKNSRDQKETTVLPSDLAVDTPRFYRLKIVKNALIALVLMLMVGCTIRFITLEQFGQYADKMPLNHMVDWVLWSSLCVAYLFYLFWLQKVNRHFLIPLQYLVQKTQKLVQQIDNKQKDHLAVSFDAWSVQEVEELARLDQDLKSLFNAFNYVRSQRYRETRHIKALMNALTSPIVAVNQDRNILFFNDAFRRLFPEQHIALKNTYLGQLIRQPQLMTAIDHTVATGALNTLAFTLTTNQGSLSHHSFYDLSIAPIYSEDKSQVDGAVCVFHDITELKHAEVVRVDFVGNVSHELRSPITSIHGFLKTLEEDIANQEFTHLQNHMQVIRRNVDRLIYLINDLLELTQLDCGVKLDIETLKPQWLTEKVCKNLSEKYQAKQQKIAITSDVETFQADPNRVEQILVNLIDNAIKYSPEKTNIAIDWTRERNWTVLSVKDEGNGIAQEHLPRLFERFYRVDKSRSRSMGGTGLGLAIVKHILQAHNGYIEVKSDVGKGCEFRCYFPSCLA